MKNKNTNLNNLAWKTSLGCAILNSIKLMGCISIGFVCLYTTMAGSSVILKLALIPQAVLGITLMVQAFIINGDN